MALTKVLLLLSVLALAFADPAIDCEDGELKGPSGLHQGGECLRFETRLSLTCGVLQIGLPVMLSDGVNSQ
eukprot:1777580-Alexandrium_andersonii.AAC.1